MLDRLSGCEPDTTGKLGASAALATYELENHMFDKHCQRHRYRMTTIELRYRETRLLGAK